MEKRNSKKEKGQALLGRPASLSAQPSRAARPPLSSLPRADARLAPPGAGHVAAVRRRRGRAAGRPTYPSRDSTPRPEPPFYPLPLSLFFSPLARTAAVAAAPPRRHCRPALRRSPQAALVALSLRQDHRRARLRRGKPLRTLYRGENPSRTLNLSPELARTRRRAPPRKNFPVSAPFCMFFSALDSE